MADNISYKSITLNGLASLLKNRRLMLSQGSHSTKGTKAAVLLGAGASVSAGIPLADQIVKEIQIKFPEQVQGCKSTYAAHMARLPSADRTNLLRPYIKNASVNAAHLYLAQLVATGYIDRILTTNFDSLAVQALILANERPNVYDLANLKVFSPGQITSPSVIHLHGQFGGFVNLNTTDEFSLLGDLVKDVLRDTLGERILIIIGYGGFNDPVFKQICEYGNQYGEYYNGLIWVSNQDNEPPPHVLNELLSKTTNNSFFLRDYDADSFFMNLVKSLGCGIPEIIEKPFTFLQKAVSGISDQYGKKNRDLIAGTRKIIEFAIICHEEGKKCEKGLAVYKERRHAQIIKKAQDIRDGLQIERVDKILEEAKKFNVIKALELIAETFIEYANQSWKNAQGLSQSDFTKTIIQADLLYRRAIELAIVKNDAYYWCGLAWANLAEKTKPPRDEEYFRTAYGNFKNACSLDVKLIEQIILTDANAEEIDLGPDVPEIIPATYIKWGDTLVAHAKKNQNNKRSNILEEAQSKYDYALQMRPNWKSIIEQAKDTLLKLY